MTRDEAIEVLTQAGQAEDDAFPLLDAAIACAIHDAPLRDPAPVRALAGAFPFPPFRKPRRQRGFGYLMVLFAMAAIGITRHFFDTRPQSQELRS